MSASLGWSDRPGVRDAASLAADGWTRGAVRAQLRAGRWKTVGRAVVLHNGPLTADEQRLAALANCGPRALLTAFTAAEVAGLVGWERPEIHVLVPSGARVRRHSALPLCVHRAADWSSVQRSAAKPMHQLPAALLLAAAEFRRPRPGCGLLAAAVQQRLVRPDRIVAALNVAPRLRHRAVLRAVMLDITQGAQALSEIDFVRLCRRARLPPPHLQAVRREPDGRRRYLDASWRRADGRTVVAEVDGAVHLSPRRWFDDQLRQNELVLTEALVLRYPSVIVRTEEPLVVHQLRRALLQ